MLVPNTLTANLIDARGNHKPTLDAVWTVDLDYIGQGTPQWVPQDIGDYHASKTVSNETSKTIEAIAGNPQIYFPSWWRQIQSGGIVKLEPTLIDINGFEMSSNLAGPKVSSVENGTVNSTGWLALILVIGIPLYLQ